MKKIVVIIVAAFTLAMVLQSCKSSEHCPAYGEVQHQQQSDKA
jgi:hypothetical protein